MAHIVQVIQEMGITSKPFTDNEINVGDPATYYIGSDSYGCTITDIIRFKGGSRKGQIKELHAGSFGRFRAKEGTYLQIDEHDGRTKWYARLVVGFQRDYRDPSL
jgi:hypothetical protein